VILCLLLTGCGSGGGDGQSEPTPQMTSTTPVAMPVTGTISVPTTFSSVFSSDVGGPCAPDAGYEDVDQGTQVVVRDADGRTVALGSLDVGSLQPPAGLEDDPGSAPMKDLRCVYEFAVTVEPGSDFYSIAVGGEQRGAVEFTAEELTAPVELSLGD
jgi:hypothetical protein